MTTITGYTDGKYMNYYPISGLTSQDYIDYVNQHRKLEDPEFRQTDAKKNQTSHKSETSAEQQWKSDSETPVKQPKKVNTCCNSECECKDCDCTNCECGDSKDCKGCNSKQVKEKFTVEDKKCRSKTSLVKDLTKVNIIPIALLVLILFYAK